MFLFYTEMLQLTDWLSCGFKSHSTQNSSLWRRYSAMSTSSQQQAAIELVARGDIAAAAYLITLTAYVSVSIQCQ